MIRVAFLFFLVFIFAELKAQEVANRTLPSFNEVSVQQAIKVVLIPSDKEGIEIEAWNIELDKVLTEVSGEHLRIKLEPGRYNRAKVQVKVYYKKLSEISVSSAASLSSDHKLKSDQLDISVSSSGDITLDLAVRKLILSASSSGSMELSGKAETINGKVSSAGSISARELMGEEVSFSASSAGSAKFTVSQSIDASASSGGSIRYSGSPTKSNIKSSSGGDVKRINK